MKTIATVASCACLIIQTAFAFDRTLSPPPPPPPVIYQNYNVYYPVFTSPTQKVNPTGNPQFTNTLLGEAYNINPLFFTSGTHVHMFYWSGPGNHGSASRLIDTINATGPCNNKAVPQNCALWDEGVPDLSTQIYAYPEYFEMNVEHWYDRAYATGSTLEIFGRTYRNANPLNPNTADAIWGQYSARYAEMATVFNTKTGNIVNVWCFVRGAKSNRIFYLYEYPTIKTLEAKNIVAVHCAKNQDADWRNPNDWTEGLGSAACPPPSAALLSAEAVINMSNYK